MIKSDCVIFSSTGYSRGNSGCVISSRAVGVEGAAATRTPSLRALRLASNRGVTQEWAANGRDPDGAKTLGSPMYAYGR